MFSQAETKAVDKQPHLSLLDLPGEIRNEIYRHAASSFGSPDNQHAHLAETYTIDRHTVQKPISRSTPQWVHNWYALRSLCRQTRLEIDSFVSATVLSHVMVKSGLHDARNDLSQIPKAFHSNIQRVAINDHGFLLYDWSPGLLACFQKPLKPLQIEKNAEKGHDADVSNSSYNTHDTCYIPAGRDKAALMLRRYTETAYDLIELPQLKQVVLTFGHWNDGLKITEHVVKKAAFMGAFSRFLSILVCREGCGHRLDNVTVLCQDTDLQKSDFEQGLRRRDGEKVDLPFKIDVLLQGETELVSMFV